ncbi:MAG: phage portal protein [Thermoguttaceae bacterium]|jgi:HK97 family phage portal protein
MTFHSAKHRHRTSLERRAASYGPVPLNDSHTLFGNYPMTSTGIRVDNYSADCNYVFRRGVEVIAQSMAKICRRWRMVHSDSAGKKTNDRGLHWRLLTGAANQYTTAYNFWELLQSWAKGWGNGYAWILRQKDLTPIALYPLHPSRVIPRLCKNTDPASPFPWDLFYTIDGGREIFLPYEILHIKGNPGFDGVTGYNLVQLHENTLAIAQAQNEYSGEFYANGAVAGGLVELPAGMKPATVEKYQTDFQNRYSSRGNRHKLALVDSGVKFTQTTIDPESSQLLEARKFSIFEIALMLGVPPTVLGDLSHGTFSNAEQQQLALNMITLHPIAENWRQELDVKMTPPVPAGSGEEYCWEYDQALKALDAADTATRMGYLHTATGGPWMSKEEAREEDGLPQEVLGTIYPPPNMTGPPDGESGSVGRGPGGDGEGQPAKRSGATAGLPSSAAVESRFNANHDPANGQFTEGAGSDSAAAASDRAKAASEKAAKVRDDPNASHAEIAAAYREAQKAHKAAESEHKAKADPDLVKAWHAGSASLSDPKVAAAMEHHVRAGWHKGQAREFKNLAVNREALAKTSRGTAADAGVEQRGGPGSGPRPGQGRKARAEKAKAAYKPASKEKQNQGDRRQREVAAIIGHQVSSDNKPMDVLGTDGKGRNTAVEVKTLCDQANDKLTMHPDSKERKEAWGKQNKAALYTVAVDDRDTFNGGAHKDAYSGNRFYLKQGVGSFRVSAMTPVSKTEMRAVVRGDMKLSDVAANRKG